MIRVVGFLPPTPKKCDHHNQHQTRAVTSAPRIAHLLRMTPQANRRFTGAGDARNLKSKAVTSCLNSWSTSAPCFHHSLKHKCHLASGAMAMLRLNQSLGGKASYIVAQHVVDTAWAKPRLPLEPGASASCEHPCGEQR